MNMTWTVWKKTIAIALALLFAADLALVYQVWSSSREGAESLTAQRDRLKKQAALLKGDVARGERIRQDLSGEGREYDNFYHNAFLSADNGYSTIEDDLGSIAAKANLRSSGVSFKQKELQGRGVTEIDISDTVEGDYSAIIQFINGLEHSKNFYLLNKLHLQSPNSPGGGIRLQLDLQTYFRTS
jgi:Tfp pilus assembly protein PilO